MGSPILQVLQTTNPRANPDALPHAPKPDSDPCPGYPQVVSYRHPASYRKSVGTDTVQKAVKTEISKKAIWSPEEESRNLAPFLPHPTQGRAMEDHEEPPHTQP